MEILNRTALIVTPKRRCLDWINGLPRPGKPVRIEDASSMRTVYLVATGDDLQGVIDEYCDEIFEQFLESWVQDESLWPVNRTPHTFRDWFSADYADLVHDADPDEPVTVFEAARTQCGVCDGPLDSTYEVVVLESDRVQRLSAEEADRLENASDTGDTPPFAPEFSFLCCSPACAAEAEAALGRVLATRNTRNDNGPSPQELN